MAKNPAKLINGALDFIGGLSSETISKHKGLTKLMNKVEKSSSELSSYNFSNTDIKTINSYYRKHGMPKKAAGSITNDSGPHKAQSLSEKDLIDPRDVVPAGEGTRFIPKPEPKSAPTSPVQNPMIDPIDVVPAGEGVRFKQNDAPPLPKEEMPAPGPAPEPASNPTPAPQEITEKVSGGNSRDLNRVLKQRQQRHNLSRTHKEAYSSAMAENDRIQSALKQAGGDSEKVDKILEDFGVKRRGGSVEEDVFKHGMDRARKPTIMDSAFAYKVPQAAVGAAVVGGALSLTGDGGRKTNAELYSNPF